MRPLSLYRGLLRGSAAAAALLVAFGLAGCGSLVLATSDKAECATPGPIAAADSFNRSVALISTQSGLKYGDFTIGCGRAPRAGQSVTLQYTAWLANGKEFDSSRVGGRRPISFVLGSGQVIPGLDQGVTTMHVGGKRRLVIPPSLGFGPTARGAVPANSTLVLDVELTAIS